MPKLSVPDCEQQGLPLMEGDSSLVKSTMPLTEGRSIVVPVDIISSSDGDGARLPLELTVPAPPTSAARHPVCAIRPKSSVAPVSRM